MGKVPGTRSAEQKSSWKITRNKASRVARVGVADVRDLLSRVSPDGSKVVAGGSDGMVRLFTPRMAR